MSQKAAQKASSKAGGRFQKLFGKREKIKEDMPTYNVKGHKQFSKSKQASSFPELNQGSLER